MSRGKKSVEVSIVALDTRITLGGDARAAYLRLDEGEQARFSMYLGEAICEALRLPGEQRKKLSEINPVAHPN